MITHRIIFLALLTILNSSAIFATDPQTDLHSIDSLQSNKRHLIYPEQIQRQKLLDNQKTIIIGQPENTLPKDSVRPIISLFYENQYRAFLDPEAPYFMLMSKDAHIAMGIGGKIAVRGFYDWNGAMPDVDFSPFRIRIPKDPLRMKHLSATLNGTGFFLTILGRRTRVGDFMGYVGGEFITDAGGAMRFNLHKAFLNMRGFTLGYTTSTFVDPSALPPAVEGSSLNGVVDRNNILLRYQHNFLKGWSIAGAIEFPRNAINAESSHAKASSPFIPDVVAFGQYSWHEGFSHVRASAMMRTLSYRNLITNKNHNILGWSTALNLTYRLIPNLAFYGAAIYGVGHSGYLSDLAPRDYDLVENPANPGELNPIKSFSWMAGLKYNFTPDLYLTGSFSQLRNFEGHEGGPDFYHMGWTAGINMFWEVTPRLLVGATTMVGRRVNYNGRSGAANRAELLTQLTF